MNILGFLAVIIICGALVAITILLCKYGIVIHRTHEDLTKPPEPVEKPAIGFTPASDKKEKDIAPVSMDAVIKAANELMGISTEEVTDGKE